MQVRLLGPVEVTVGGVPRPVSGLRRKTLLSVLGLRVGEIVSTDRLIDVIWGDTPPATVSNALQSHVSYLRRLLGTPAAIVARPPGYLLDLPDPDATDVRVAERLIGMGRQAAEPERQASLLRSALDLWRGRALVDVADHHWLDQQAERLEQLRLAAVVALVEARLALGEHASLVPELERLTRLHPLREDLHGQLMLALYRCGRQADALRAYQLLRHRLREELGVSPSRALRDREAAILRQDPSLDLPAAPVTVPRASARPAQLPAAVRAFVGREPELAYLDATLADGAGTVAISVISGTAGVGKTTLAVHWAHRVAHRFPDGQLYVNLRGFDPSGPVLDPAEAVRGFLEALGVPADRIPRDLSARAALYRSLVAGRRILVLLDNARDADQVRPLLPGTADCVVLVTSRSQLTALVATEGAHPLPLGVLTPDQARKMLTRRLSPGRTAAEPDAVEEIVTRCAGLPLALAIVAAHAAGRPDRSLAAAARQLREAARPLDALSAGDSVTDVRTVFFWSYRALGDDAARMFRLLGLHPGPDIGVPAAAALADVPLRTARALLAELVAANLLIESATGRYTFHDLLRAYARERAEADEPPAVRQATRRRMLDHYLHTAHACVPLLNIHCDRLRFPEPEPGATPHQVSDYDAAMAWLTDEHAVLLAAIRQAADHGEDGYVWRLAWTLTDFAEVRGHWQSWTAAHHAGLAAAQRCGDRVAQACLHRGLGRAYMWQSRFADAHHHYRLALELFTVLDDRAGQARTHHNLSQMLAELENRPDAALDHAERALRLCRSIGDEVGIAKELNMVGWCHALLGEHRRALGFCQEALRLQQRHQGLANQEAATWDSLGYLHHQLGDPQRALDCYRHALHGYRRLGDRYHEAAVLVCLGDVSHDRGDAEAARTWWRDALTIFDALAAAEADGVRQKLDALPAAVAGGPRDGEAG